MKQNLLQILNFPTHHSLYLQLITSPILLMSCSPPITSLMKNRRNDILLYLCISRCSLVKMHTKNYLPLGVGWNVYITIVNDLAFYMHMITWKEPFPNPALADVAFHDSFFFPRNRFKSCKSEINSPKWILQKTPCN